VFSILSHYCSSGPNLVSGIRAGKRNYGLQFFTRALPCFTEIYSLFYPNGVKIVPENIYELLTPPALAHIIMGDGSAKTHGLTFCTFL
jgi:LAGLIDADG DNA endonuclease family